MPIVSSTPRCRNSTISKFNSQIPSAGGAGSKDLDVAFRAGYGSGMKRTLGEYLTIGLILLDVHDAGGHGDSHLHGVHRKLR